MSTLPFATARQTDVQPDSAAEPGVPGAVDVRDQVLGLKKKLEEAAGDFGRLQTNLASQQQLEDLLKQGRAHLQDLRAKLLQVTAERDRLQTEFGEYKSAHQREVDRLQAQIDETAGQALRQQTLAQQRERDMLAKEQEQRQQIEALGDELQKVTVGRDRLTAELEEREATYKQFREERTEERFTFERLIAEATSNQRDMVQELDEKRQQIETLREAAMRSQSLAREIMRAHEQSQPDKTNT
jgi:chromosome segregation ATPase